ncbi:hypothetical protein EDC96DRAFT_443237 [Choanephora cucurbitarum]|nr:hypothetical protein EDC96DRAFT_443237 [Choanephora cucurbitarum]
MWNNLYNMKPAQFLSAYEQSGIMPYVYTHPNPTEAWPSLQAMIDSNQRLVNFVDVEADVGQVPWLMDQFSHVFETPYENTETFNCNIDRISQDLDPTHMMYVLNHFLYGTFEVATIKIHMPLKDKAEVANGRASLDEHVLNCSNVFQKKPNFVEVDFYSIGQSLSVVAELNGVSTQQLTPKSEIKTDHAVLAHKNGLLPTDHVLIDNSLSKGIYLRPNLQSICLKLLLFNMVYRGIF